MRPAQKLIQTSILELPMHDRLALATRDHRRLPAAALILLVAAALLFAHSAANVDHGMGHDHHGAGVTVVVTFCLAILELGLAIATVQWFRRRQERVSSWRLPWLMGTSFPTVLSGPDPPPRLSAPQLQVFLR